MRSIKLPLTLLAFLIWMMPIYLLAQVNIDEQLGAEYYNRGDYEKALTYYKKLLDTKSDNPFIYERYYTSVLNVKDYKGGETDLKKIIKRRNNSDPYVLIDLGYLYQLENKEKEAKKVFESVIDKLPFDINEVEKIATAFLRKEHSDYALNTYKKAQINFKQETIFISNIADIYLQRKEYQTFVNLYVGWMDKEPQAMDLIKSGLQESMNKDEIYNQFKKEVLRRINDKPDDYYYADLMAWIFLQRKDFNGAYIQYKSIDKRLKEGGKRLVELGLIASNYGNYSAAENFLNAVVEQGKDAAYYYPAQKALLDIKYNKITKYADYTTTDIQSLIDDYSNYLKNFGFDKTESGEVILKLAEIKALYANQLQDAIQLLESSIDKMNNKSILGRLKLALGDYYLINDNIWESTLRYSQVEKMFPNEPLGHEAKYRNAKLAFYTGEFEWCKAQLTVLKGSTEELIANDALQLALLIDDYLDAADSSNTGANNNLRLFAKADLLIFQNKFDLANKTMDSIKFFTGLNTLADDILMLKANISLKKKEYLSADSIFKQIYTDFPDGILSDDALYKSAVLNEETLKNTDKAKSLYEKIILEYKGSVFGVDAANRFRKLRGDVVY